MSKLISEATAGEDKVDPSLGFMEQEAISAIADLTEPWKVSMKEQGIVQVGIVKGAQGGVVSVFFQDDSAVGRVTKVQRGEEDQ